MFVELKLFEGIKTADGNTKTAYIDAGIYKGGLFFLKSSAVSGTDPTLDVDIITYDEETDDWYILDSFDRQDTSGNKQQLPIPDIGKRIAIQYKIDGTDPSFTFKVSTILKDR